MAIVNYVKESKAFIAYASDNKITANEFVLWHALFHIFNQRATSNVWPDGFVPVSNSKLLSFTTFGCGNSALETLRKSRDRLIQRGLIEYRAGERNKRNPMYRIIFFNTSETADFTQEKLDNPQGNPLGNMQGNPQGNPLGNVGDIINKLIRDGNCIPNSVPREDDDDPYKRAYERARREAEAEFSQLFGRMATTSELDHIAHTAATCETTALLHEAMERAAAYGAKNPAMYVATICGGWYDEGITTRKELAEYDILRESIEGKTVTGYTRQEATERLQALRERLHNKKDPEARGAI